MPSPFPGMDPFLEDDALWPAFQHQLVGCLYQILLPGLVDRYRARVGQRAYITEQALFTSVLREERHEEYIEIRQRGESRLVTLVEVVSPANKLTPSNHRRSCATEVACGTRYHLAKRLRPMRAGLVTDKIALGQPVDADRNIIV